MCPQENLLCIHKRFLVYTQENLQCIRKRIISFVYTRDFDELLTKTWLFVDFHTLTQDPSRKVREGPRSIPNWNKIQSLLLGICSCIRFATFYSYCLLDCLLDCLVDCLQYWVANKAYWLLLADLLRSCMIHVVQGPVAKAFPEAASRVSRQSLSAASKTQSSRAWWKNSKTYSSRRPACI